MLMEDLPALPVLADVTLDAKRLQIGIENGLKSSKGKKTNLCGVLVGEFEAEKHFYPRVLNGSSL
jgi:hypothetical protein